MAPAPGPGRPGRPGQPGLPGRSDRPGRPQTGQASQASKAGQASQPSQAGQATQPSKASQVQGGRHEPEVLKSCRSLRDLASIYNKSGTTITESQSFSFLGQARDPALAQGTPSAPPTHPHRTPNSPPVHPHCSRPSLPFFWTVLGTRFFPSLSVSGLPHMAILLLKQSLF